MAVFVALILGSLAARLVGWLGVDYTDGWPQAIAVGLAVMFTMTGFAHFVGLRRDMIAIVPPRSPASSSCSAPSACSTRPPAWQQRSACSC
jgi:hypothetical protein